MKSLYLWDAEDHVSRSAVGNGTRAVPPETILLVVRGMILAKEVPIALARRELTFNQDLKAVLPRDGIHNRFLLYLLLRHRGDLLSIADEAAHGTKRLQTDRLLAIKVRVPPIELQQRIATLLSAYDDLIDNNTRRIAMLEEMALRMFEEWFVRFRAPGCEAARLIDSSLGKVPEGWEVRHLDSLIADHIGGGWGKDEPDKHHTQPAWVVRGTDIPNARACQTERIPYRIHKASNLASRTLVPGDIIFEVSGGSKGQPVGRTMLVTEEFLSAFDGPVICASFCKRVRPNFQTYGAELLYLSFIHAYGSGEIERFQVQSTGISNFKWTEYITKAARAVPPLRLRRLFGEHVTPLLKLVSTLGLQNRNLRTQRDLLLPKLMSGEIDVSANGVLDAAAE